MRKMKIMVGLVSVLTMLILTGTALAQSSTDFDLSWWALAGGGARVTSSHYALDGTLGQWAVGPSDGSSYSMDSGYWQRWLDQDVFLPLLLR